MLYRPPGRDDPDSLAALGIGHMHNHAIAHAEQTEAFLAIGFSIVDPFDREWIAKCLDRSAEGNTMRAPVGSCLVLVLFEGSFIHRQYW
jgi:hypothetical protein